MKVGIIGLGYVGGAVRHWFEKQVGCDLYLYDKYKGIGSVEEVNQADVIFVAVPTPYDDDGSGYDDSAVHDAVSKVAPGRAIVIKSTVLPGTTARFQERLPRNAMLFNPEFLREKTHVEDFLNPPMQIVGHVRESDQGLAAEVLGLLPSSDNSRVVLATEAELVKYWVNSFLATRVVFANEMHDLAERLPGGPKYETVVECLGFEPRVGTHHFDVKADGYRGYGGSCLPKDTKSLIDYAHSLNVPLSLLTMVDVVNDRIRKESGPGQ